MRKGASLILLLVTAGLAGCFGGDADRVDATTSEVSDLGHLVAETADAVEVLEGGLVVFTWDAVTVGRGALVPDVGAGPSISGATSVAFPVDERVGIIETTVVPTEGVQAFLSDHEDRVQCGLEASADGESTCTGHIAWGADVEGGVTWRVQLASVGASVEEATATVRVILHPVEHLHAIREAADAALARALDSTGPAFVNVRVAEDGGEPTMGVLADGTLFYASAFPTRSTGLYHGAYLMRSTDGGHTWEDVTPLLNGQVTLDPMMHADPWTGRVFADQLTVACSNVAWSDDEGETWVEHPWACGEPGNNDHQKLTTGGSLLPGNPVFDGVVYHSSHSLAGASLDGVGSTRHITASRSLDGGVTWTPHVALTEADLGPYRTGGPIEADRYGNVYIPVYLCGGDGVGLAVTSSNDHGATWNPVAIPAPGSDCKGLDPGMAVDSEGNAYVAGWGGGRVWVSASRDHGATWDDAAPVSVEALRSQVLVDAVAGDAGRVAVAYLGTADTDRAADAAPGYARWHLYLSYTEDALAENALAENATWRTVRVTPADDPVQYGSICTAGVACFDGNRNLLDFIDVKTGPDGRVYVAYTDGCIAGANLPCWDPPSSLENHGMIAVQDEAVAAFRLFVDAAPWAAP